MATGIGVDDATHDHQAREALTYRSAGVDIRAGNEAVRRIRSLVEATHGSAVVGGLGGFAGAFAVPGGMREPLLVASTDGVGTKLLVAIESQRHDTVGIDLVAMVVNDLLVTGARPLFLLDYIGTGVLSPQTAEALVAGVAEGCLQSNCALLGGEMAELPGMYAPGHYDLAAFGVGVVERTAAWGAARVQPGDGVIALHASGLHSNGYSLARKALLDPSHGNLKLTDPLPGAPDHSVADALLTPTTIYERAFAPLRGLDDCPVHAAANITGGGLVENPQRSLKTDQFIQIDLNRIPLPRVLQAIRDQGVAADEMRRTFNCGVGMLIYVDRERETEALDHLHASGYGATSVGRVHTRAHPEDPQVRFEALR
ncbi:MAG: phosphoribosylformylglycinamidine cyclo-ligase [Nannocystaceae bacterium]